MTNPDPAAHFKEDARAAASVRGHHALRGENYSEAIRQFKLQMKDIKQHGGSVVEKHNALFYLGMAYLEGGSKRKAVKHLKEAARLGSTRAAGILRSLQ